MSEYKLKPCPFCGGEANIEQTQTGDYERSSVGIRFQIRCKKCHSTASTAYGFVAINLKSSGELNVWHNDIPKAVEAWNRRCE